MRKLFRHAHIYTPIDRGAPLAGRRQGEVIHISKGAILTKDGLIAAIGDEKEVMAALSRREVDEEVDCRGIASFPVLWTRTRICALRRDERKSSFCDSKEWTISKYFVAVGASFRRFEP